MPNDFKILNQKIGLGETVTINMDIARLTTRSKIDIPIIVSRGKTKGPCLLLIAGIHGDETNGVEIVRQIIAAGYHKPEKGTIICIPLLNVFGFLNQSREFPDGRDLNRMFPGSNKGSSASKFAYYLMKEVIPKVDYCIDYHTGGAQRFNYSQVRINGSDETSLELAKVFGAPFIVFSKSQEKTFRNSMVKLGKKVLLFEGGKSLNLDKNVTKTGVQGAINVMHYLGFRDFSSKILKPTNLISPIVIKNSKWIRAKHSGMYRSYISAGQKVEKGIKLGSISDPYGELEKIFKNPQEGYILNSNHSPVVIQGDALIHIGFE
ncbi:succinylglutamate desuccinylase/aspartoacylase family protein [Lutibacter sp. TH_r2]|uniref:succinylglutamate desuccinylase/aspartoacylase family protein n=1 Tax=Lutibacter sp. TH_r2 TaxID=3082083 RepID=UPI0029555B0D|nr:succinylglutamate desuccinylase/aspartoacylase family protein [Lutibacter sp. TH_r2]MDV7186529.1 succinylglutamate desuccinylase/aspartoacylase family protein [Lutibacter sp. TH_r2]